MSFADASPPAEKFAEKAHDPDVILKSVEDAASVAAGIWLPYLFSLFYFGAAVGGVTHTDLLVENAIKLPFLQVELPLLAFFVLAPALFLISHAYTLVYFVILAAKVGTLNRVFEKQIRDDPTRDDLRRQLPSNIFVQFLAGPKDIRDGGLGLILKGVAWSTLVFGPILLLLWIEVQFLPFHRQWITWWHRILILADVILLWLLWPAVLESRSEIALPRLRDHFLSWLASLAIIILAFTVVTFPGEAFVEWIGVWRWIPPPVARWLGQTEPDAQPAWTSLHDLLFCGPIDQIQRRRHGFFSDTLVLSNFSVQEDAKSDNPSQSAIRRRFGLRGRNLEQAVFLQTDLHGVDLTNARLRGAQLAGAKLQGARLTGAQLQGATLDWAALDGADLNEARLQGAFLSNAKLHGATLFSAQAQGAIFDHAELQGASLEAAQLQGASLKGARLQGAWFDKAKIQGVDFREAALDAANISGAAVWRASVADAQAQSVLAEGLDEKEMTDEEFVQLKSDVVKATPPGERRDEALKLINEKLDPHISGPETKQPLALKGRADKSANQKALVTQLEKLICSGDDDAAYIVTGLIANMRIDYLGAEGACALVKRIDDEGCLLSEQDKADLKRHVAAGQIAGGQDCRAKAMASGAKRGAR
jgi:uncharacterized protein YjbI with pentapeptide repeats